MNRQAPTPNEIDGMNFPSLFQLAAHFEDFFPTNGWQSRGPQRRQHPLAHWLSQPEKLRAALQAIQFKTL